MNVPNEGIVVYKNGTKKGSIDGHDFKKLYSEFGCATNQLIKV